MSSLLSNGFLTEMGTAIVFGMGYYLFGKISERFSNKDNKKSNKTEIDEKPLSSLTPLDSLSPKYQRKTSFASCESGEVDFIDEEKPEKKPESKLKRKCESAIDQYSYSKTLEVYKKQVELEYNELKVGNDPFMVLISLQKKGVEPTIDIYNCLLYNSYQRYGNTDNEKADELINEIFDSTNSIEPNLYTLNIIIKGLGMKYKDEPMEFDKELAKYFEIFTSKNISIDISTYNSILECLVEMHRGEDAWIHYINMQNICEPEYNTVCLIIKNILYELRNNKNVIWIKRGFETYTKFNNDFNGAFTIDFLKELISKSLPEKHLKSSGMEVFEERFEKMSFDDGFLVEMLDFYMQRLNLEIVEKIYNKLSTHPTEIKIKMLKFCTVSRLYDYGMEIYESIEDKNDTVQQMMIRLNMFENKFSYMLDKFFKDDLYKQCSVDTLSLILNCSIEIYDEKRFDILTSEFENKTKNSFSHFMLMKGYYNFNKKNELIKELNECLSKNMKIDRFTYNQIVEILLREKDIQKLKEFTSKISDYEFTTDNKLKLLTIYIEENNATKSYEIFNEIYLKNFNQNGLLNDKIINDVIQLQIDNNYIDRSITLFNTILKNNYMPNFQLFDAIINQCIRNDYIKDACDITILALEKKISLDANILLNLSNAIQKCEKDQLKSYEKIQVAERIFYLLEMEDSEYKYNNTLKNGFYKLFTENHQSHRNGRNNPSNTSNEKNKKYKYPSTPLTNYCSEDEVSLYDAPNLMSNQKKQVKNSQKETSLYESNENNGNENSIYNSKINKNNKKGKRRTTKQYIQPQEEVSIYG